MRISKNTLKIFAVIMSLTMVFGAAIAFGAVTAAAAEDQESEATNTPDIPVIDRPYQTTDELGIDIEAIDALYPQRIEARYENGILYVDDNGYSEVSVYSNDSYDMELSDGVWSVEISDRAEGSEFIYLYSQNDDKSVEWSVAYVNGERDSYINISVQDVYYYISVTGTLTITYSTENGLNITDRYAKGVLEKHEVSTVIDDNASYSTVYKADGSVNYCDLYIYDPGSYYYLFPDKGWSSSWAEYIPCEAPSGYEHLDLAFFTEKMPSLLCSHDEWNEATCTSPKSCKSCGETEGEALGHAWNSVKGVCSTCGVNIVSGLVFANTVYNTVDEIGIQYKEINSRFPMELEYKYEDGKYMIKDIGAWSVEVCSSVDWNTVECTLVDGYWVCELSEDIYNDEAAEIHAMFSGEFEGNEWMLTYVDGKSNNNLQTISADGSKYTVIYRESDWVEFIYTVGERTYRDMYKYGNLDQQTVEAYKGDDRLIIYYDNNGSAEYVHVNLADGNWFYYFLDGGWSTYPGIYDENYACAAPEGYENADFEYFTSICPTGIGCTHEAYGEASCTEPERCTLCGASKEGSEALGHDVVDATCCNPAYCRLCDMCFGDELGHDTVTDEAKAPTCTESGLSEGAHCSRCDAVIVEQAEIGALGHDWADATYDAPKTCLVCGETEGKPLESDTESSEISENDAESTEIAETKTESSEIDKTETETSERSTETVKTETDTSENDQGSSSGSSADNDGESKDDGCGSSIGMGAVAIVTIFGAALIFKKKS